jgi:hypothetical protein
MLQPARYVLAHCRAARVRTVTLLLAVTMLDVEMLDVVPNHVSVASEPPVMPMKNL